MYFTYFILKNNVNYIGDLIYYTVLKDQPFFLSNDFVYLFLFEILELDWPLWKKRCSSTHTV